MDRANTALRREEMRHGDAATEEWLFTAWSDDGSLGLVSGYRITGKVGWYWAALARAGEPLLHVADWSVVPRPDPLLVKGEGLWAEHVCDAPMEQWTVANETYATALDDPDDARGRAYGTPTALSWDLEWYATASAVALDHREQYFDVDLGHDVTGSDCGNRSWGYGQVGVVHGVVELPGAARIELDEAPAHRWHRWGEQLGPLEVPTAIAHHGRRLVIAFPDGTEADWVLTPDGWRSRQAFDGAAALRPDASEGR